MKTHAIKLGIFSLSMLVMLAGCDKENVEEQSKGRVQVEITDAPIDNAEVEAVFITASAITVDGKFVEGFKKQTIEISSLTEGSTELLVDGEIEAGAYSDMNLILDLESSADGSSPGCYVLTTDGVKHNLASSSDFTGVIELDQSLEVASNSTSQLIIDMDLRKSIRMEEAESSDDNYEFVSHNQMLSACRSSEKNRTGTIEGDMDYDVESDEKVVVYAYRKGTFNSSEANVDSQTSLRFVNAETSTMVNADGSFTLAFLEEGEYELVSSKYRSNAEGDSEFESTLNLNTQVEGLLVDYVKVEANAELMVSLGLF